MNFVHHFVHHDPDYNVPNGVPADSDDSSEAETRISNIVSSHSAAADSSAKSIKFRAEQMPPFECKRDSEFVPFELVKDYPFMYVGKQNKRKVTAIFKDALLGRQQWDFFAIVDPSSKNRGPPLLLLPTIQFTGFLGSVNEMLATDLSIPKGAPGNKFHVTFEEFPLIVIMSLGRLAAKDAPGMALKHAKSDAAPKLTDPSLIKLLSEKSRKIHNSLRNRKDPEASKKKRTARQTDMGRVMKRVQRYLGLRERAAYATPGASDILSRWEPWQAVPFTMERGVRFVCVDVEASEHHKNTITEIGFAVLDVDDIERIPPGATGVSWQQCIRAYHFRVEEFSHIVNHTYVTGCPGSFNFGISKFVPQAELGKAINDVIVGSSDRNTDLERVKASPVVLVGHDLHGDLEYLHKAGFNIAACQHVVDEVDTQAMYRRLQRSLNISCRLSSVCSQLQCPGHHFHNAGNDAVYTMHVMISAALMHRLNPFELQPLQKGEDLQEWSEGDLDDGGLPRFSWQPSLPKAPAGMQTKDTTTKEEERGSERPNNDFW